METDSHVQKHKKKTKKKEKKRKTNRISIALCPWIYFCWLSWAIATDLLFSLWFIYIWFTSMDSVTLQKKKKKEEKRGVWQEYLNISVSFFSPNLLPNHIIHMVLKKFPTTEHLPKIWGMLMTPESRDIHILSGLDGLLPTDANELPTIWV